VGCSPAGDVETVIISSAQRLQAAAAIPEYADIALISISIPKAILRILLEAFSPNVLLIIIVLPPPDMVKTT
jgi:hypothetical protein